jgi:hypothetical protein
MPAAVLDPAGSLIEIVIGADGNLAGANIASVLQCMPRTTVNNTVGLNAVALTDLGVGTDVQGTVVNLSTAGRRTFGSWRLRVTPGATSTANLFIQAALPSPAYAVGTPLAEFEMLGLEAVSSLITTPTIPVMSSVSGPNARMTGKWYVVYGSIAAIRGIADLAANAGTLLINSTSDVEKIHTTQPPRYAQLWLFSHVEDTSGTMPPWYEGAAFMLQGLTYAPLPRWVDLGAYVYVPGGINEDTTVGNGGELFSVSPVTNFAPRLMGADLEGQPSLPWFTSDFLHSAVVALPPIRALRISAGWNGVGNPLTYLRRSYRFMCRLWA